MNATGARSSATHVPFNDVDDLPEPRCPRCKYNVFMLSVPRCPECGCEFEWDAVMKVVEDRRRCPTFEYHWRLRPFGSLLATWRLCLQPWRLWRQVPFAVLPKVVPLIVVVALSAVALFATSLVLDFVWHEHLKLRESVVSGRRDFSNYPWQPFTNVPWSWISETQPIAGIPFVFAGTLWLAMTVFRRSILPSNSGQLHALRIVLMALAGLFLWRAIVDVAILVFGVAFRWIANASVPKLLWQILLTVPVAAASLSTCLAFGSYLKLRRPWFRAAMVVATAASIVFLSGVVASLHTFDSFSNPSFGSTYWDSLDDWCPLFQPLHTAAEDLFFALIS